LEAIGTRLSGKEWWKLGVVFAAITALYFPVLTQLVREWQSNASFSHGFLIPPLAVLLVWDRRHALGRLPVRPSNWGLLCLVGSIGLLFLGSLGAELFLTRFSLLAVLASLALFLFGWRCLRGLIYPVLVLGLMIPLPQIIFNQIAFPLQLAASRLACGGLKILGIPVLREGNLIFLPHDITLEVAEACSGIRSLAALVALGVAYGRFFETENDKRVILLASTIPIAILANSFRIAGTGLLTYFVGEQAGEGFFHAISGGAVFVCAFVLIVLLHGAMKLLWRDHKLAGAQ
jgi:exosortase